MVISLSVYQSIRIDCTSCNASAIRNALLTVLTTSEIQVLLSTCTLIRIPLSLHAYAIFKHAYSHRAPLAAHIRASHGYSIQEKMRKQVYLLPHFSFIDKRACAKRLHHSAHACAACRHCRFRSRDFCYCCFCCEQC